MVCNFEDERRTEGVVLSRITMWAPNLEPKHNSVWSELTKSSCLKLPNLETKPDSSLTAPFRLVSPPPWADCRPKISWSSIWLELKSHYCHFERNKEAHRLLLQKKSGAAVAVKGKICPPLRQHWLISYLLSDFTSVHVCMWQWLLLPSCPHLGVEREGGGHQEGQVLLQNTRGRRVRNCFTWGHGGGWSQDTVIIAGICQAFWSSFTPSPGQVTRFA